MALKPHLLRRKTTAYPRTPTYKEHDDLVELRARTIAQLHDDPLRETDWWSMIGDGPMSQEHAHQRAWRLKKQTVTLAKGIWSIASTKVEDAHDEGIVVARFEGYEPWWEHMSARARKEAYRLCVRSDFDNEPIRPPRIPRSAYGEDPEGRVPLYGWAGEARRD